MRVRPGLGGLLVLRQTPAGIDGNDLAHGARFGLAPRDVELTLHCHALEAQRLLDLDAHEPMTFDGVMGHGLATAHFNGKVGHTWNPLCRHHARLR